MMFKSFLTIMGEILFELLLLIKNVLSNVIYPLSKIMVVILPYLMFYIGYRYRSSNMILAEVLVFPVVILLLSYILKSFSNKIGKGETPPIPRERFTSDDGEGEVSCDNSRLPEMLLFVNEYEKWLERKGLL